MFKDMKKVVKQKKDSFPLQTGNFFENVVEHGSRKKFSDGVKEVIKRDEEVPQKEVEKKIIDVVDEFIHKEENNEKGIFQKKNFCV